MSLAALRPVRDQPSVSSVHLGLLAYGFRRIFARKWGMIRKLGTAVWVVVVGALLFAGLSITGSLLDSALESVLGLKSSGSVVRAIQTAGIVIVLMSGFFQAFRVFEAAIVDRLSRGMRSQKTEVIERIDSLSYRLSRLQEEQELNRKALNNLCVAVERQAEKTSEIA